MSIAVFGAGHGQHTRCALNPGTIPTHGFFLKATSIVGSVPMPASDVMSDELGFSFLGVIVKSACSVAFDRGSMGNRPEDTVLVRAAAADAADRSRSQAPHALFLTLCDFHFSSFLPRN